MMKRLLSSASFLALLVTPASTNFASFTAHDNSYIGFVATRGKMDGDKSATNKAMFRTGHYARTNITSLNALFANFYVVGGTETGTGSNATITASVEYPPGTCTQLKFSGSATGTVLNLGTLLSDNLSISIPNGAQFWIRLFFQSAFGIVFQSDNGVNQIDVSGMGDASVTVSPTDQTVACGALTDSGTVGAHGPLALIGNTSSPSVCILGDSIAYGSHDVYSGSSGDIGIIERSIGPSFGYSNISSGGDQANQFVAGHTLRATIFPYCSSAIVEYGRNDLYSGAQSLAQLEASLTSIYGYFTAAPIKGVYQTTLVPDTMSTDSWATTVNQQPNFGGPNVSRATLNAALRAGTFTPGNFFDVTSVLGNSTDFQLWNVNGTPNFCTSDGVHPSPACYAVVQSSGIIPAGAIK